jgi:uncharacterized repeat protein (TIGR01451 family)
MVKKRMEKKLALIVIMLAFALSFSGAVSAFSMSDNSCPSCVDPQSSGISSYKDSNCQSSEPLIKDTNVQSCDQSKDSKYNSNDQFNKDSNVQTCDQSKDSKCNSNEPLSNDQNVQSCDQYKNECKNHQKENNFADLSINKTVDVLTPNYLTNVTWTITVVNNGPNTATNVLVKDMLPAGLQYVSDDSNGAFNPLTGIWSIGTLGSGASAILNIITTVTGHNTAITDVAKVTADQCDKNLCNNVACATINVPAAADIGVTKTVNNSNPIVGDTIGFLITATNNGPDNATGLSITDLLNPALQFVSANPSVGTYNSTSGIWTIGNLAYGVSATLNLVANVINPGIFLNTATVSALDQFDPNLANNSASVIIDAIAPAAAGGGKSSAAAGEVEPSGVTNLETVSAASNAIPLKETGLPIALLLIAVFMTLGGFILPKRK